MNIENAVKNLKKRGFDVSRFGTKEEAAEYLASQIKGFKVGIGGSMTLRAMDIYNRLKDENQVYWHMTQSDPEKYMDEMNAATHLSEVYLCSANAIAGTGEILNIDGRGNRVAALMYGKERVYMVVGINKFADTFRDALWRARNIAAPKNAQRLGMKTPCAVKGDKCYDCSSPQRICSELSVLWGKPGGVGKIEVVIIDQELGM